MEYEVIKLLKESEKSTVHLVREKDSGQTFIRKSLSGDRAYPVYRKLQECEHPYLPKLLEVTYADNCTTIMEEYIEGETIGSEELSEKQFISAARELCTVLEFIHEKGIIHRDIKPSNIILAKDGHIRLIDFDIARIAKEEAEQDTRILGTRGYAPPEQYGFSQTDERADIYSLGVTLNQLSLSNGKKMEKRYQRIINKCMNLNPDKRYQSAGQVKRAFFHARWELLYGVLILLALLLIGSSGISLKETGLRGGEPEGTQLTVLRAPDNPHWKEDTGIAVWGTVLEAGASGEQGYHCRLYRMETEGTPDPDVDECIFDNEFHTNFTDDFFELSLVTELEKNGFYYFDVCAAGDGAAYTDSPYVMSDVFEYTGESAPPLPTPTGLSWVLAQNEERGRVYFATWSNLDDYEDDDSFTVIVTDKDNNWVTDNSWSKKRIMEVGYGGIKIRPEFLTEAEGPYRFYVQAYSSRPNEYSSSYLPEPVTEEYYSPWFYN